MKKYWWFEKWVGNFVFYGGELGRKSFRLGLVLGQENTLYLGLICMGVDYDPT